MIPALLRRPTRRAIAAAVVFAAAAPLASQSRPASPSDKYGLLTERNIFLRSRRQRTYSAPSPRAPVPRAPRDRDADIILTGIGIHDGKPVAFFEDSAGSGTFRVGAGEPVGNGKARAITLDGVEYERDGTPRRIEIGYALNGGRSAQLAPAAPPVMPTPRAAIPLGTGPTSGPTSRPTSGPAAGPAPPALAPAPGPAPPAPNGNGKSSDVDDILKRMRQRREQELRR